MSVPKPTELKVKVFELLYALYLQTGGRRNASVHLYELGQRLGFNDDEMRRLYDYLQPEDLIRVVGNRVGISGNGRAEIEQLLQNGEETTHFLCSTRYYTRRVQAIYGIVEPEDKSASSP